MPGSAELHPFDCLVCYHMVVITLPGIDLVTSNNDNNEGVSMTFLSNQYARCWPILSNFRVLMLPRLLDQV